MRLPGLIKLKWVIFGLMVWVTAACSKPPLYQEQGFVFGTRVEISIYGESDARAQSAVAPVMQEFQRLHNLLHAWKPGELSELNAAFARGQVKEVTPELANILTNATQLSVQSGGLFNPAIGGIIKLWGFHADEFKPTLPDRKELLAWVSQRAQMSDINVRATQVSSRNKAVQLDLGGYAKGYALDQAARILQLQGIDHALINVGGNVLALGKHGERAWRVGIQHSRKPGPIATLELNDGEAIGTSGDYQRYFMLGDKRYCHLIDPRNGHPVQNVQAVTVLTQGADAGVKSDAGSKPLFISGVKNWHNAAKQMNITSALLVDNNGTVHLTAAMHQRLELTDPQTKFEVVP
ncbi:MAG: FAD:protein FMN transferase [Candidatus Nitrotoga sp.]